MLEQGGPLDPDLGPADDHAVDVAAQPAAGGAEAELPAGPVTRAQLEAGGQEPGDGQVLEGVPDREDPQRPAVEPAVGVMLGAQILVGQAPRAGLADAGCRRDSRAAAAAGAAASSARSTCRLIRSATVSGGGGA